MVLDSLGESLRSTLKKILRSTRVDKELIKDVVRDLQRALLKADVNVRLALEISKKVEKRALEEKPPPGKSMRDHLVRIIYEEIVKILGEEKKIELKRQKIMLVGLYGQGKTTTAAKLAKFFQRKGLSVCLVACDVHRPAAYHQLKQLAEKVGCGFFGIENEKDALKIARESEKYVKDYDVKIYDTSGRHSLEEDLIEEIKNLKKIIKPDEIYLVIDATMGQQAGPQAKAFHDAVGITGVIITKLDGTAKGGGALSAVAVTGAPIVFIGVGEHIEDLEHFDPPRFIARLLGMGDLQTLMEVAREIEMDEKRAEETAERLLSGKFNLKDMYEIYAELAKPGFLKKILSSLPFLNLLPQAQQPDEEEFARKLRKYRVIMDSMTYEELENPDIIKGSRIDRIARGSGMRPSDVRELLKEYSRMKSMMKSLKGNRRMMRMLKKQLRGFEMGGV